MRRVTAVRLRGMWRTMERVAVPWCAAERRCTVEVRERPQDWSASPRGSARSRTNVERVVRGKHDEIRLALVALLAEGHLLIEDVPGRRQDDAREGDRPVDRLLVPPHPVHARPAPHRRHRRERLQPGATATSSSSPAPIFANIVLGDEINRASPKTQSALLECMEERQVTVDTETHPLGTPFMVIATQNPIEHEGTYPLPEAQLDRFMLRLSIGYPSRRDRGRDPRQPHGPAQPLDDIGPVTDAPRGRRDDRAGPGGARGARPAPLHRRPRRGHPPPPATSTSARAPAPRS